MKQKCILAQVRKNTHFLCPNPTTLSFFSTLKMQQQLIPGRGKYTGERIVIGNNNSDKSNILGKFYASNSLHGGNESFHDIDWKSLSMYQKYMTPFF